MVKRFSLLLLASVLFIAGCTKEDLSDCGIEIAFKYDNNSASIDRFPTDIDKIDLFVFDAKGVFVGEYIDEGSHLDNSYRMRLKLNPGTYDLIAWGNLRDDFDVALLTPGVSTLADARLSLKHDEGTVAVHPKHLYHGSAMKLEVKPANNPVRVISMIKNTNFIKAIFRGLPITVATRAAPGTQFSCRITGKNGSYEFGNSLASEDQMLYIPQYNIAQNELVAEFVVMRLFENGATDSRITLYYHPSDGMPIRELFSVKLLDVIKAQYPDSDLDRDDEFILPFDMDYTNGNFTVTINGWEIVGGGGVIG